MSSQLLKKANASAKRELTKRIRKVIKKLPKSEALCIKTGIETTPTAGDAHGTPIQVKFCKKKNKRKSEAKMREKEHGKTNSFLLPATANRKTEKEKTAA